MFLSQQSYYVPASLLISYCTCKYAVPWRKNRNNLHFFKSFKEMEQNPSMDIAESLYWYPDTYFVIQSQFLCNLYCRREKLVCTKHYSFQKGKTFLSLPYCLRLNQKYDQRYIIRQQGQQQQKNYINLLICFF